MVVRSCEKAFMCNTARVPLFSTQLLHNNSGEQDFCVLLHCRAFARKEIKRNFQFSEEESGIRTDTNVS